MLNEWTEFQDYAGVVNYTARNKQDTTYLGRFTFDTILDFEGLNRVLTILARGFLFHNEDGSPAEMPRDRIDYAKRGLCAWCSVPDSKKSTPREAWQFGSEFGELHSEFPGLVDENGSGWFHRHVHRVVDFCRFPCSPPPPRGSGACGLTVFWPRRWNLGRLAAKIRNFRLRWWSDFAASRPRAFPWRWWRRWWPTTLPTRRRTPTGWCCRWPTLTHISAPPALGVSISGRSQRPF